MKSKPGSPDYCGHDLSHLFTLRVRLYNDAHDKRAIVIYAFAFEGPSTYGSHTRIDVEVRHGGKVIFPRGSLYCGIVGCIDGIEAREAVLSLVAMRPGDTDEDYFANYTPAQLEWVREHGEALSGEASARYCDPETGGCCKSEAEAKRLRKAHYAKLDASV